MSVWDLPCPDECDGRQGVSDESAQQMLRSRHDGWAELYGMWVQPVLIPPSTGRTAPVMYSAPGEQRKRTAWATSSGCPRRPAGIASMIAVPNASFANARFAGPAGRRTWITPGAMQFTLMCLSASSI